VATFDDLVEASSPVVADVARGLREVVVQRFPEAIEQIDLRDRIAAYGVTERMRDIAVAIAPHAQHVNLQLADGIDLPDPEGIVEGTGKRIRHVKCRSVDDVERPALLALIDEQIRHKS
jgi:hypothetical protein